MKFSRNSKKYSLVAEARSSMLRLSMLTCRRPTRKARTPPAAPSSMTTTTSRPMRIMSKPRPPTGKGTPEILVQVS